jgi:NAD(P)-dependent dehydrogenase (short-subunit alcohol dehydrogenase family)
MTLEGKHVLILGGSSGIGLAVAEAALAAGAEIGIASSRQARIDHALDSARCAMPTQRIVAAGEAVLRA